MSSPSASSATRRRSVTTASARQGVTISEVTGGEVRLVLDASTDPDAVLRRAMSAGTVTEFVVERLYRDAPLMVIGEGTNEIQRLVFARGLLARAQGE